jgi:hypothetical protein
MSNPIEFGLKIAPCAEAVATSVAMHDGGVFGALRQVD